MISISRTNELIEIQVEAYRCTGSLHKKPTQTSTMIFSQFIEKNGCKDARILLQWEFL